MTSFSTCPSTVCRATGSSRPLIFSNGLQPDDLASCSPEFVAAQKEQDFRGSTCRATAAH